MSYTRPYRFEPGSFLRPCDLCGIRYLSTTLVRGDDGFWRCRKTCAEVTQITRDKISAQSQRRVEAPPPRWGLPYDQRDTYSAEAQAFNFLALMPVKDNNWPGGIRFGAAPQSTFNLNQPSASNYSYVAAGDTCRYLYNIIKENGRPAAWITSAKAKLRELADWLLGKQNTTGTPDTNIAYGGFDQSLLFGATSKFLLTENVGAGMALLFAYDVLGDAKYIVGARAVANMVRAFQWTSQLASFFTSSDSAGTTRLYLGGHCATMQFISSFGGYLFDHKYQIRCMSAIEFLTKLIALDGDATYGGLGVTGPQSFVTTGAAKASSMLADAIAFWQNGTLDNATGKVITGFSSTTPKHMFNAFPNNKGDNINLGNGTGSWEYFDGGAATGTQISGQDIALALRATALSNVLTSQSLTIWKWLMAFSSNSAFVGASGSISTDFNIAESQLSVNPTTPPSGQGNIVQPSYNPKIALAPLLLVRDSTNGYAPIAVNATSQYESTSAGSMAMYLAVQDSGSLRKAKNIFTTGRLRHLPQWMNSGDYPIQEPLMMTANFGLNFQTSTANHTWLPSGIANTCNIFRYGSTAFVSEGRPDSTQPGAAPGTMQVQS